MKVCAARDQGPSSAGMARHLAPFSWRQRMAEMVRRRSFGCVLPLGRHASTNGSKFAHGASDTIALSSFQKEQNARHHKQFKREQALAAIPAGESPANRGVQSVVVVSSGGKGDRPVGSLDVKAPGGRGNPVRSGAARLAAIPAGESPANRGVQSLL